jgi:hypothetical protein
MVQRYLYIALSRYRIPLKNIAEVQYSDTFKEQYQGTGYL